MPRALSDCLHTDAAVYVYRVRAPQTLPDCWPTQIATRAAPPFFQALANSMRSMPLPKSRARKLSTGGSSLRKLPGESLQNQEPHLSRTPSIRGRRRREGATACSVVAGPLVIEERGEGEPPTGREDHRMARPRLRRRGRRRVGPLVAALAPCRPAEKLTS